MAYIEGVLLMELGGCKWCGCTMYGSRQALGCSLICEKCDEAETIAAEEDFERDDD